MKNNLMKFLSVSTNIRKYLNDKSVEEGGKRGIYNIFYYRLPPTSVASFWIAVYVSLSTSYS